MKPAKISFVLCSLFIFSLAQAKTPDHYMNDPKNLNTTPGYTPGDYPIPDAFAASTLYMQAKENLVNVEKLMDPSWAITIGVGEIKFTSMKNKTAPVPGSFRSYTGVAQFKDDEPTYMEMLVDINSMDTAIPGRNYRILELFFQSVKPEFGSSVIKLDKFDISRKARRALKRGREASITATGTIDLNGQSKPLSVQLLLKNTKGTWSVKTEKPINLSIADYKFGNRIYDLMKECNHKSIGDSVTVDVDIYLR